MAGFISQETIDAILNTTDIISTVGEYTRLERRGGNDWWGCCPFHGEKTASFHVDGDKKFYHCFGCHKGGNAVNFIMEMEKLSYPETLMLLAKKAGIVVKYKDGFTPSEDTKKFEENNQIIDLYDRTASLYNYLLLETEQGKNALDYITKRGLTLETIKKFKLGFAPSDPKWLKKFLLKKNFSKEFLDKSGLFNEKYPDYSFFSNRLMFPIMNRKGQVVAFTGRVLPPASESERKYVNSRELSLYKKRETLFGFNFAKESIRKNKSIIVCEGNMDVIAYHQCGLDYAVAVMGTALTEEYVKVFQGFVGEGVVYLSFDSDDAGEAATWKSIKICRFHDLTVKIIRLKGGKDPAEIMLKYGAENLTAQVNSAILDSDYLLLRLGEKYPVDTPEGKKKAAKEYFEYVDSLQSEIFKESCLEVLCQTFNLKLEAVKRDFINRNQAREPLNVRQPNNQISKEQIKNVTEFKLDAEIRALIAVTADLDQFKVLCSQVNENDFQNPVARKFYKVLEECYKGQRFTIRDVLSQCDDENLIQLITESISSGIYQSENVSVIVKDTISYVKKNALYNQREALLQRIKNYTVVTEDDQKQLNALLSEKINLDKEIHKT